MAPRSGNETPGFDLFRKYGEVFGQRPWLVLIPSCIFALIGAIGWIGPWGDIMTNKELQDLFSVQGGQQEKELKALRRLHGDVNEPLWRSLPHVTMLVGKGQFKDADIFTPEVFEELLALTNRYHNLSVTTGSGKVYTSYDMCNRGNMPDRPSNPTACAGFAASGYTDMTLRAACAPSPLLPCRISTPLDCFAERAESLESSYRQIDPIVSTAFPASARALPFSTRPSFRSLTAAGMKAEASKVRASGQRGCDWWTASGTWTVNMWAGTTTWNEDQTQLLSVPAIQLMFFPDAPKRMKLRLGLSKPSLVGDSDLKEALAKFETAWQREIDEFSRRSQLVEVVNLRPNWVEEVNDESSQVNVAGVVLSILGMIVICFVVTASFAHPQKSRANLAWSGMLVVILAIITSGGIYLFFGFQFNSTTLACLPFLALGLGVDDMFIMIRSFNDLGTAFITENSSPQLLGELFARCLPGVTLTSICNAIAFGCGGLLPVAGVADFCVGAALVAVVNYLFMTCIYPACILLEASRVKSKRPELNPITYCFHKRSLGAPEPAESSPDFFDRFEQRAAKVLEPFPLKTVLSLAAIILFVVCCVFIGTQKKVGYDAEEMIAEDFASHRALQVYFDWFNNFYGRLCFIDTDVPQSQRDMLELHAQVTSGAHTAPSVMPYLSMFYNIIPQVGLTPVPNTPMTLADVGWRLDSSWTLPLFAPSGIASQDPTTFYQQFHAWWPPPLSDPTQAFSGGGIFRYADLVDVNEFKFTDGANTGSTIEFSFFNFLIKDIKSDDDIVAAIKHVRDKIDSSPLKGKAFPSSPVFTYWEIFAELDGILAKVLIIDLSVICLCSLLMLQSILACVVAVVTCLMIVLEIFGISVLFLKFNVFVVVALLASVGMSVEFVVHTIACYSRASGTSSERAAHALARMAPPVLFGALSTFAGILPIAFSPTPFVVKYMFGIFALVVLVGTVNGLIFLPAFLAALGPIADRCGISRAKKAAADCSVRTSEGNACSVVPMPREAWADTKNEEHKANPSLLA